MVIPESSIMAAPVSSQLVSIPVNVRHRLKICLLEDWSRKPYIEVYNHKFIFCEELRSVEVMISNRFEQ